MKRGILILIVAASCARDAKKEPTLLDRIKEVVLRTAIDVICTGADAGVGPDGPKEE